MSPIFFKRYFEREKKGGRKKGRETSMCGCLPCTPYQRPGLHIPGMLTDWELNQGPSASQASTQSTEHNQPGQCSIFIRDIDL